jgi:hypothetical protein
MIETLGTILAALSAIIAVGVLIACYVAWRSQRRTDDAQAAQSRRPGNGGGGGPSEPA